MPTNKIILEKFKTKEEAINAEIVLHNFFDVSKNPNFANKSKQTSAKFFYTSFKHKNNKYKKRNWHHQKFGNYYNLSVTELIQKFSDQNLQQGHLSSVALGGRNSHKGWTILNSVKKERGAGRNWYHPEHGIYLNISNRKLCSLFPREKYHHNTLSKVIKGELENHKGWMLYHTAMTKQQLLNI